MSSRRRQRARTGTRRASGEQQRVHPVPPAPVRYDVLADLESAVTGGEHHRDGDLPGRTGERYRVEPLTHNQWPDSPVAAQPVASPAGTAGAPHLPSGPDRDRFPVPGPALPRPALPRPALSRLALPSRPMPRRAFLRHAGQLLALGALGLAGTLETTMPVPLALRDRVVSVPTCGSRADPLPTLSTLSTMRTCSRWGPAWDASSTSSTTSGPGTGPSKPRCRPT